MARWNKLKKVLEHQHTKFWVYSIDPADEFVITDTTFRDGQQARPPYTVQQIETIFDLLHRLSGANGVIRQTASAEWCQRSN